MRAKPTQEVAAFNHEGDFLKDCPCNVCKLARLQGVDRASFNEWLEAHEKAAGPGQSQEHAKRLLNSGVSK